MLTQRAPLRSDVLDALFDRWIDGRLPPGRVNESALSEELGISRTPLREALLMMEQRGLLDSSLGRGFSVRPLSREEAGELYPLLSELEPIAIRFTGTALSTAVPELRARLQEMATTSDANALRRLSAAWGQAMIRPCPNSRLRTMIESLHRHAARYEYATLSRGVAIEPVLDTHQGIVDAIERGDIDIAADAVGATWRDCLKMLLEWLPAAADAPTPKRFKR
jgi:DNA-binding GntR family transcriptional regulator